MPQPQTFLGRVKNFITGSSYDAVQSSPKRRSPRTVVRSEDEHLKQHDRKKLIATTRDLRRNFSVVRWAINRHLDFVVSHSFRSKSGDPDFDRRLEAFVAAISGKRAFDQTRRHPRRRFMRLLEAARVVDGDIFAVKLRSGHLQAIEGDRIRSLLNDGDTKWVNGLRIGRGGLVTGYGVHRRLGSHFEFERVIPANRMMHFCCVDRFDQYRGISPLASALNEYRDVYEGFDLAKARAKVNQIFTYAIFRDSESGLHDTYPDDPDNDTTSEPYKIDFSGGPQLLDLDPGDDVKSVESRSPAGETQEFWRDMLAVALKALDIPRSFYQENYVNYAGGKAARNLYFRSVEEKREDVRDFLNEWLPWRLKLAIESGVLQVPVGYEPKPSFWRWIPSGTNWLDANKEMRADAMAVENAFRSRRDIVVERTGQDFFEVVDELAEENDYMLSKGIAPANATPDMLEQLAEKISEGSNDD